jgi:hypothetical protein
MAVAMHISNKMDFKPKLVRRHKECHSIVIKGIIHEEDITPNLIKQTLQDLKIQMDLNTMIVGDFNIQLSPIYRTSNKISAKKLQN